MIAIFDHSEEKVVIISDRIYRISFSEFSRIESRLKSVGLILLNSKNSKNTLSPDKSSLYLADESSVNSDSKNDEKEYIGSSGGRCVIVNGLEPKLQFMGLDDVKSISNIHSTYGSIPEAISLLIKNGQLVFLSETEKAERIEKMKQKMAVKGKSVKQASSKSVRLSESVIDDSAAEDSSDINAEDRVIRNAVKIDL